MSPAAERLVEQAVAQGFGRHVADPDVLRVVAAAVTSQCQPSSHRQAPADCNGLAGTHALMEPHDEPRR